jgi:hypothetical protein
MTRRPCILPCVSITIMFACLLIMGAIAMGYPHVLKGKWETRKPDADAALIDEAWKIPGVILVTPHRPLSEYGINLEEKLSAPMLAVKTARGWCGWSLGTLLFESEWEGFSWSSSDGRRSQFVSSYDGYPAAFASFKQCVDEGNAVMITGGKMFGPDCGVKP